MSGRLVLPLLAVVVATGCATSTSDSVATESPTASPASAVEELSTESLLDGQERWLDQKPDAYTMTVT